MLVPVARYELKGKPLCCPLCGHDDFLWHEGLKESRAATFLGFDWAKEGVDKLTCIDCAHTLSFARITATYRPQAAEAAGDPIGAPGL